MLGNEPIEIRDDGDGGEVRPWDRQPGERVKDYKKFLIFRDLEGIRSIQGAYRRYVVSQPDDTKPGATRKKPVTALSYQFEHLCRKYRWRDRADAWDLYVELENRKARLARRLKQAEEFEKFELHLLQQGFKRHADLVPNVDAAGLDKLGGHLQKTVPLWRRNLGLPAVDATVETRDAGEQLPEHLQLAGLVDEICRRAGLPPVEAVEPEPVEDDDDESGNGDGDGEE